eukprot:6179681-Pleurochrysis_carterae.AAC.2
MACRNQRVLQRIARSALMHNGDQARGQPRRPSVPSVHTHSRMKIWSIRYRSKACRVVENLDPRPFPRQTEVYVLLDYK